MIDRKLVVRFFRVAAERGAPAPGATLTYIGSLTDAQRFKNIGSYGVRADHLATGPAGLIVGDFVRLQVENIPAAAGPTTPQRPLNLPQGDGLAHNAAFAFDPATRVLALQGNRNGLSPGSLAGYLGSFVQSPQKYEILPVLRSDALRRLRQLTPTSLEVKIAAPDDLSALEDDQLTAKQNIASMREMVGGGFVEIAIGVGRRQTPLKKRPLKSLARWFAGEAQEGRGGIEKLRIVGTVDDDDTAARHAIDLLKEVMQAETVVSLHEEIQLNFRQRLAFILHSMRERRQELSQLFREA